MPQKIIEFSLDIKNKVVYLQLSNKETITIYKFANSAYSVISDGLTKGILKDVKKDCLHLFNGELTEKCFKDKWLW